MEPFFKGNKQLYINPLHYSVIIIYGLTRLFEYVTSTNQLWTKFWYCIVNFFGADDFNMYFIATIIYSVFFLYWFIGGIYVILDTTLWPKCLRKYKVQKDINEPIDKRLLIDAARVSLKNQIFVTVPTTFVGYLIIKIKGNNRPIYEVPDFSTVVYQLMICIIVDEIVFYYTHRLVHQKKLYQLIHKQHHEWSAPIAIAASFSHPLEHLVSNILPIGLGPVFANSHLSVAWIWHTLATITTLSNHSGYHFPFMNSSEFHDFHHLKFIGCYGKLGLLDRIHNTDKLFQKSIQKLRHRTLFSLKSARETFPDKSI